MLNTLAVLMKFSSAIDEDPNRLGGLTPDIIPNYEAKVLYEASDYLSDYESKGVFDSFETANEHNLHSFGAQLGEEIISPVIFGIEEPELLVRILKKLRKQQEEAIEGMAVTLRGCDAFAGNMTMSSANMVELFSRTMSGQTTEEVSFLLRSIAEIIHGDVAWDSKLLNLVTFKSTIKDKLMAEIEAAPQEWVLAFFDVTEPDRD